MIEERIEGVSSSRQHGCPGSPQPKSDVKIRSQEAASRTGRRRASGDRQEAIDGVAKKCHAPVQRRLVLDVRNGWRHGNPARIKSFASWPARQAPLVELSQAFFSRDAWYGQAGSASPKNAEECRHEDLVRTSAPSRVGKGIPYRTRKKADEGVLTPRRAFFHIRVTGLVKLTWRRRTVAGRWTASWETGLAGGEPRHRGAQQAIASPCSTTCRFRAPQGYRQHYGGADPHPRRGHQINETSPNQGARTPR